MVAQANGIRCLEFFLRKHFQGYYSGITVEEPPEISQREFGIGEFGRKITQRHLSFPSFEEFNYFLRNSVPFFVSYSSALYGQPSARPMDAKNMVAADLVYEFDADDIKTECKLRHDSWQCLNPECKAYGRGSISHCTSCGNAVKTEQWFCQECLDAAKKQAVKLVSILQSDFNVQDGIVVNFSGNAGYHIHIRNHSVRKLKRSARIELLDYLTINQINLQSHGFVKSDRMMLCPKSSESIGLSKLMVEDLVRLIEEGNAEKIAALTGMPNRRVKQFLDEKDKIVESMRERGVLFSFPGRKTEQFWQSLLEFVVSRIGLDIDRQTSLDLNKIIRVPETLHGGTGLVAKKFPLDEIKKFNPLDDAVAFSKSTVKVFINKSPKFYLNRNYFGPFEDAEEELPLEAAIYLLARNSAVLAGEEK